MNNHNKTLGTVIEIFSASSDYQGQIRPIVKNLKLIEGYGIKGDKFAGKNLDSTVLITGIEAYEIARASGIEIDYGSLGENILLNFNTNILRLGDILTIGNAQIQIMQKCTICNHLSVYDKRLPKLIKNDRGLYCKIVKSGTILKGMKVEQNIIDFEDIKEVGRVKEVIKEVFGLDLNLEGDWGYDQNRALIVKDLSIPIKQFENTFATMRSNIEMNLTLPEDKRYGAITVHEHSRKQKMVDNTTYDIVTFKINAIKEDLYAKFIQEYKDGYGKDEFDIQEHFLQRQKNTLERYKDFWFVYGL